MKVKIILALSICSAGCSMLAGTSACADLTLTSNSLDVQADSLPGNAANNSRPQRVPPAIHQNAGDIELVPLADREQDLARPKLGNGTVADTQKWPASFVMTSGDNRCTATLIGPQVLLTAAHCVGNNASAKISYADGSVYEGTCSHAMSDYPLEPSADWALCLMQSPVQRPKLYYEYISLDPTLLKHGTQLLAGGFGCTSLTGKNIEDPPLFRTGPMFVDRIPESGQLWPNWIFTTSATRGGSSFLCMGDSGGALYWESPSGQRLIVAVGSGTQATSSQPDYLVSYLAALSTSDAISFINGWLAKTGARVCGIGSPLPNCRITPP